MPNSGGEHGRHHTSSANSVANALSYVFQFLNPSKESGVGHEGDVETGLLDVLVPDLCFASAASRQTAEIVGPSAKIRTIPSRVVVLFARRRSASSCLLTSHDHGWWMPFLTPKPEESNSDAAIRLHKMVPFDPLLDWLIDPLILWLIEFLLGSLINEKKCWVKIFFWTMTLLVFLA
jgi:hypothetical protein